MTARLWDELSTSPRLQPIVVPEGVSGVPSTVHAVVSALTQVTEAVCRVERSSPLGSVSVMAAS